MSSPSASASASTGINAPGGTINKNNPGVVIFAIGAVVLILIFAKKRRAK